MIRINKYLDQSFRLIESIEENRNYKIRVGKTKHHSFNKRELSFLNIERDYKFSTSTEVQKGVQHHNELTINRNTEIKLKSNDINLYTKGKYFLINNVSYTGHELTEPKLIKLVEGKLTSISNQRRSFYSPNRRYRIILPLKRNVRLFGDFKGWGFYVDKKIQSETLLKVRIINRDYHFYIYTNKEKESHFIVDALNGQSLEVFQKSVSSILLSYAFLKGEYHGEHSYILTYDSSRFENPISILTQNLGGGMYDGFAVHSTNPYSIVPLRNRLKYKKDRDGKIVEVNDSGLKKFMIEFPNESFSKLCELINTKGGILRAVIMFVSNNKTTLEMKVPIYFVALENISKVLIGGDRTPPKLIDNNEIVVDVKKSIKTAIREIDKIKKKYQSIVVTEFDQKGYDANFARITGKLNDFNRGTNNKKLKEPFDNFGYKLTKEEEGLILIHRNKFLHGDDFKAFEAGYDYEFKELFHISMKLHKLISILLLKAAGYSGYILNNSKIYEYISEKKSKESYFIKI